MINISFILLFAVFGKPLNEFHQRFYSTKTPYQAPSSSLILPLAPSGYEHICTQLVARHGCRALEGRKYDQLIMALWEQAKIDGALTPLGDIFGEELKKFIEVNDQVGRGELTGLGKNEHQQLARRLVKRLSTLFEKSIYNRHRNRISVVSSGQSRATASLNAFVSSLPSLIASQIDREADNPGLLYFHLDSKYQNGFKKAKLLKNKIRSIQMQPYSREMARQVLEQIFHRDFVERLSNEEYSIVFDQTSSKSIKNELDAAIMLHSLYLIAPNLREEGVGDLLDKYFHFNTSAWFAYLHDSREFYEKGPSFSNQTSTFEMAKILRDDFFEHTDLCSRNDGKYFLRARFAHAETIIPFSALLKIPFLTDQSTPVDETFTYENNVWRGELVSPMAANIQWDIFRHKTHEDERPVLVRMLYNERPVSFKSTCQSYDTVHDSFYTLEELKRCYTFLDQ